MSGLPKLTVVSAGAGSGKTFRIKQDLGIWVKEGLVAPDRIVAVTFTEAAASELKERVRRELLDLGRPEDALMLDQAYISTIHSFGLRLLTEFAFEAGMPPRSRLLEKNEEIDLLRQAIARAGGLDVLTRDLSRFGYTYDGGRQKSGEDQFRDMVRKVIGRLRTVGQNTETQKLTNFARLNLTRTYGSTINGSTALDALHGAVTELLHHFPADLSVRFAGNASAVKDFRKNHTDLAGARDKGRLAIDWSLWQSLRNLRRSKKGSPTPEGYDERADDVVAAAEQLPAHPGPLADAIKHAEILIGSAVEAIEGYAADKRQASLVDYADMLAAAHLILASENGTLDALSERVDCLVIDEFQDTNPLQFSLLWLLYKAGIPTLIVGDLKQAIMEFQGADPRLMQKLLKHTDTKVETLDNNWRTQPSLMPFINCAGHELFGDDYVDLSPQTEDGFQTPLEVLDQPKPPSGPAKRTVRAQNVATRVRDLLDDPDQFVRDQGTGLKRRLKAQDIAILCPTNGQLQTYADALRSFGVKAKMAEDGWIDSRTVQLALHAVEFAENPNNRHAGLYLSCTELGEKDLSSALSELMELDEIDDPVLSALSTIHGDLKHATIVDMLSEVICALDLYGRIAEWPDSEKHRADLLRLEAEARSFVDAKPETLASGGFFGSGTKTFVAWLDDKVQHDRDVEQRPDPDASTTDAVETVTWHRSKGREWPVVFVCGWDAEIRPSLPEVSVEYEHFDDLDAVLDEARISFVPQFAAPDVKDRYLGPILDRALLSARRLIYVALTRAKERLVVEWHSHLDNSTRTTHHSVFVNQAAVKLIDRGISIGDIEFPCVVTRTNGLPPELPGDTCTPQNLPVFGRRALRSASAPAPKSELFTMPSSREPSEKIATPHFKMVTYGKPLMPDMSVSGAEYGSIIHRCFEVLTASPDAISSLSNATGHPIPETHAPLIAESHKSLMEWLKENFSANALTSEVPFTVSLPDGSTCTGLIDLIAECPDGIWIIDHKTEQSGDHENLFRQYWPQLEMYVAALTRSGLHVTGAGLNLVNEGKILLPENSEKPMAGLSSPT